MCKIRAIITKVTIKVKGSSFLNIQYRLIRVTTLATAATTTTNRAASTQRHTMNSINKNIRSLREVCGILYISIRYMSVIQQKSDPKMRPPTQLLIFQSVCSKWWNNNCPSPAAYSERRKVKFVHEKRKEIEDKMKKQTNREGSVFADLSSSFMLFTHADRQCVDIPVTVCLCVCTVTDFFAENKAGGVKLCTAIHRRSR